MAARYGEEAGGSSHERPGVRRTLSTNDAVPLKSRLYSAWYRFRYGEPRLPSCAEATLDSTPPQVGSSSPVSRWTGAPFGYWADATMQKIR